MNDHTSRLLRRVLDTTRQFLVDGSRPDILCQVVEVNLGAVEEEPFRGLLLQFCNALELIIAGASDSDLTIKEAIATELSRLEQALSFTES